MFADLSQLKVFVRPGPTDMRKQSRALAVVVEQEMGLDPFAASLYVFCNRRRDLLKVLYWDLNGFALWQKRLEKHKFAWPETEEMVCEIDELRLRWLLEGIDFWRAHRALDYTRVS